MWNDENINLLKKMWADGETAEIIAPFVGKTRNAVIGKVHRLGLMAHRQTRSSGSVRQPCAINKPNKPVNERAVEAGGPPADLIVPVAKPIIRPVQRTPQKPAVECQVPL